MMEVYSIYKKCPVFFQNVLCSLKGYYLERQRYGKNYDCFFSQLIESDLWSKEQIISYKEEHLYKIIEYAYNHVPFYTRLFKKMGLQPSVFTCLKDLQKFPILTKEDVRNNWKGMISDEFSEKDLIPYHTSGSTGKALDFYWTKESLQYYWAVVWRGRNRFGIKKGDGHLNFTGKLVVPIEQNRPPYWRYNKALNQYMFNMQHLLPSKMKDIVDFINNIDFKFFVGYPSIIYSMAILIDEIGLVVEKSPDYIFSSAEKMYEHQLNLIENVFKGSKVVEHYGFSENAAAASKCIQNRYHEDFELGHLELKDAVRSERGKTGTMLATGFQNYAMPFIRYDIGDTATFTDDLCSCGLKSQVINDIEGRNEDYIITPEGAHIMRLDYIFKESSSIKECQIIQRELGSMILKIVRRDNYNMEAEKKLIDAVKENISPSIKTIFEYVDEIPRTKSGKFKAVISELNK